MLNLNLNSYQSSVIKSIIYFTFLFSFSLLLLKSIFLWTGIVYLHVELSLFYEWIEFHWFLLNRIQFTVLAHVLDLSKMNSHHFVGHRSWIMVCSHTPKKKTTTKTTQGWSTISAVKSGGIRQATKKSHLCIVCCFDVHKARH